MTDKTKVERNTQQKINRKRDLLFVAYFALVIYGAFLAIAVVEGADEYQALRSDDYMDDPTIPYNERENATYTFTDTWLKEKFERCIWWAVPGAVLMAVGIAFRLSMFAMPKEEQVHKDYCSDWSSLDYVAKDGKEKIRYCPECGLKLSRLKKD